MVHSLKVQPDLDHVQQLASTFKGLSSPPNLIPLCASIPSEFLTPAAIYLKLSNHSKSDYSIFFESAPTSETISRYNFFATDPRKIIKTGPGHGEEKDPMPILNDELSQYRVASIPELQLPPMTGGAIGYVGYDCVKYFEPKTKREMKDILQVPESLFMFFDTIVVLDHFYQKIQIITYLRVPSDGSRLETAYSSGCSEISRIVSILNSNEAVEYPNQPPIQLDQSYTSNIGQAGYKSHVDRLKQHIIKGDIIQAVPSQRLSRPTSLHPFNIYRQLRTVNPSPYLFYIQCSSFQIIGASPELLVKSDGQGRIITHPIAGTIKRGATKSEDDAFASTLRSSAKDRAEHVMLVDLARNDINRVCDPLTTKVDKLMVVQKFSHVQHLVSEVSGVLRKEKTRFDAFKSIFPAGTVSGAPKVRAMELIAELEGEKRGVYAGAVGYFGYDFVDCKSGEIVEGAMDTCIALRTMVVKDGVVYLQAGGGIVFDSDPEEEYIETLNKLKANITCIETAEKWHWENQNGQTREQSNGNADTLLTKDEQTKSDQHVDFAAG